MTRGILSTDDFPADVLYEFRLYSLGTQLVLWATIAVVFASMVARLLGAAQRQETYIPA